MEKYTTFLYGKNIVKISILFKSIYRFDVIPIKISIRFFMYIEKLIPKYVLKTKVSNNRKNK